MLKMKDRLKTFTATKGKGHIAFKGVSANFSKEAVEVGRQ